MRYYNVLIRYAQLYDAQITYSDLNSGWFNPELIKIVLDEMLTGADVDIYFNSDIYNISTSNNPELLCPSTEYLKNVDKIYSDKILTSI